VGVASQVATGWLRKGTSKGDAASKWHLVPGREEHVMLKRIPVSATLAGLALTGALCACGSATHNASAGVGAGASLSSSPATPSSPTTTSPAPSSPGHASSPPIAGDPIIFAVRLGAGGFQPKTLRISPGQHFVVIVDSSVKASGPGLPSSCSGISAPIDDGMLTVQCTSGDFSYTAQRAGTAELMATVRPRCSPGTMCPQWIAEATLKITIL
jgi:hypothetical protein